MTTTEEKISALEWGIEALQMKISESKNNTNPFVQMTAAAARDKVNVLRGMINVLKALGEAKQ